MGRWRVYGRTFVGARGALAATLLLAFVRAGAAAVAPLLLQRGLGGDAGHAAVMAPALGVLLLAHTAATLASRATLVTLTKRAAARLRRDALARALDLPRAYHDRVERETTFDRIVHHTERVDTATGALLVELLPNLLVCGGILAVLAFLDWALLLLSLSMLVPVLLFGRAHGARVGEAAAAAHASYARFSEGVHHVLERLDLTRARGAGATEAARASLLIDALRDATVRQSWTITAGTHVQQALFGAAAVAVLFFGRLAVERGSLGTGDLLAFLAGMALLRGPASGVASALPVVIEGDRSLREVLSLLAAGDPAPYAGRGRLEFDGHLRLDQVSFSYGAAPLLRGFDLDLSPGRVVALVGPNGSGKTTVLRLALGFYRPTGGSLLASGVAYDQLDLDDVRRGIGWVPQEPMLFSGSVRDNVIFGRADATAEELQDALRLVGAAPFVARLPGATDARVGEGGERLSGGQRQRLALARALIGAPALLLLDEPGNHLDASALGEILAALRARPRPPAVLLVSHGPGLELADEVVRIDDGARVAGPGSPAASAPPP